MILTLLLLLIGIIAGMAAGLFGIGGGLLFTPILFYLFQSLGLEQPATWAIATSLFCTFAASLSSTIQQRRERNFFWKEGLWVGLTGSITVYIGKSVVLAPWFTTKLFAGYFTLILFWVAYLYLKRSIKKEPEIEPDTDNNRGITPHAATGGAGGVISSLAGVGGGIVMVPMMNLIWKIPVKKAVSISSLAIVFISLSGWLQYAFLVEAPASASTLAIGFVDFGTAIPLITGAFAGGLAGVRFGVKMNQKVLYLLFSLLICMIAISMIVQLLR